MRDIPGFDPTSEQYSDERRGLEQSHFAPQELGRILIYLSSQSQMGRKNWIRNLAKEKGITPEAILSELRTAAKSKIDCPEKVLHYHQTSLNTLKNILEDRALLSQAEIKKRRPETKFPYWTASDEVMMTMDRYGKDGKIYRRGLASHGIGAAGQGVTFVMGPAIIDLNDYDCISPDPTVSNAPLESTCQAILVQNESDKQIVEEMLERANLPNIAVELSDEWTKRRYAEEAR